MIGHVIAAGAVSALGSGRLAYHVAVADEPAHTAIAEDPELVAAGLTRPRSARVVDALPARGDRATALLSAATQQVVAVLDTAWPAWREQRIGLCVGTSSGGMLAAERFFAGEDAAAADATYFAPHRAVADELALPLARDSQIIAACASSTIAIGLAGRWLGMDLCDIVLAGGYDGISLFVAAGFEALRATSKGLPAPFRVDRDGMHLGEGAGMLALVRDPAPNANFAVTGYGASGDAVHITAPDRDGGGLIRAGRTAMVEAGVTSVPLVSAHGTATPYNDAAEARAIRDLTGDPAVHPFKAHIGHTLGAAGVLELLSAADAMEAGVLPACCGEGPIDEDARVRLPERGEAAAIPAVLKLSAAFGGVTAALVASRSAPAAPTRVPRAVRLLGSAVLSDVDEIDRIALAERTGIARDRLARIDDLGQLTLAAVAELATVLGREALTGAGIVAGHGLATLDTNARFSERLRDKGARWVDPRLFPATSPNAGAGHVAIAYGLVGPTFAVGASLAGGCEALARAAEVIAAGDAERMVVVAADDAGPAARRWRELAAPEADLARGGVALLLGSDPAEDSADPTRDQASPPLDLTELDALIGRTATRIGHLGLIDWLNDRSGS